MQGYTGIGIGKKMVIGTSLVKSHLLLLIHNIQALKKLTINCSYPVCIFMSKNMSGSFSYLFLSILYYFGEFWEKVREFWDIKYRVGSYNQFTKNTLKMI